MLIKRAALIVTMFLFCVLAALLGAWFVIVHSNLVDLSVLEHYDSGKPSLLLDDEGQIWGTFELEKHEDVALNELPQYLIQAFVAAEDHAFFQHVGISWTGILRSLIINCYHGTIVQGASTITQQLVKLLFTDSSRTFKRKIKEQLFALLVERQFSKQHILQTYLNHIYFGAGVYGVEAASQRFWGISARELSLEQAATLAAIVKNPGHYCPLWYPLSAQRRRNIVLRSMEKLGFIDDQSCQHAMQLPMMLSVPKQQHQLPYIKEAVRQWLEPLIGRQMLYRGGLRIGTTINQKIQSNAEKVFADQVKRLRSTTMPDLNGGLITIDVATGHIKALVGGFDFKDSQFNRALQARRQIGSIIKPLIYASAVEAGISLITTADDEPFHVHQPHGIWEPRNATRKFEGTMTLARALANSNNIIAIKTLLAVTPERVVDLIKKCHVEADVQAYPALALGCVECTVKEVAGMFNIFANNGRYVEPCLVRWVRDSWGKKIVSIKPAQGEILSSITSGQVTSVLRTKITRACERTGTRWSGSEAIGKTGTTNDARTLWFAGSTPNMTTVVYLGTDDNRALGATTFANRTVFPIWYNLHKTFTDRLMFTYDSSLIEVVVNGRTGTLCADMQSPEALSLLVPKNHYVAGHLTVAS